MRPIYINTTTTAGYQKALPSTEAHLLNQCFETYVVRLKRVMSTTRIGKLFLKEHAITEAQLRETLQIQKTERRFLGEILVKMRVVRRKKLKQVLHFQNSLRLQLASTFVQGKLRLGQILVDTQTITRHQLKEALKKQKETKEFLGKTLVEMKTISRNTLKRFLKIQKDLRKIVVMASLALLLAGCATGTSYNYQGVPSATPYDAKYKRVLDYLKTACRFKYEADIKGADHWQLPEETEKCGKGDCEDKAIWLYSKLLNDGFDDVRLVIGKRKGNTQMLHAWVGWYQQGKMYVLDPTYESRICEARQFPRGYYKPYYSFYRDKSWTHRHE